MKTIPSYTTFTKDYNGWICINDDYIKLSAIEYIAYETEYKQEDRKEKYLIGILIIHTTNHIYKYYDIIPATVSLYKDNLMDLIKNFKK